MGIDHQVDIASPAAVAPIGSSQGHIFLSAETEAAVAARSRLHVDFGLIEEQINP